MELNLDREDSGGLHYAMGLIIVELSKRASNSNDILNLKKYQQCATILKSISEDAMRYSI